MKLYIFKKNCKHKKYNYKKFFSIEVKVKNCNNLNNSFKIYFKEEIFEKENAVLCDKCKNKFKTFKHLTIYNLPRILVVLLKRFDYNEGLNMNYELNIFFEFPFILDFREIYKI